MKTFNEQGSQGTSQSFNDDYQVMTPTKEAEIFDNGPESPSEQTSNNAVKGVAWLLGIFGVFAVAILIAWIIDINRSPFAPISENSVPRPAKTEKILPAIKTQSAAAANQLAAFSVSGKTAATPAAPAAVKTSAESVANAASSASALSKADQDRIEREALEVIHGDYGNNPGRKDKLGADYAAVQARVNQLLHI